MKKEHRNIGIVAFSWPEGGNAVLSDIVNTLGGLAAKLYIIVWGKGNPLFGSNNKTVEILEVQHAGRKNLFTKTTNYAYTQLKISFKLLKLFRRVDLWFFALGTYGLVIPVLTAKLLRKPVLIYPVGSVANVAKVTRDFTLVALAILDNINYTLADGIIADSRWLIEPYGLRRYENKVFIGHTHFIGFNKFKVQEPLHERDNLVGYVGRFSQEKGILNFLEAIPLTLKMRDDVRFLIVGDGQLRARAETYIQQANLSSKVKFLSWVPHDELPSYLNEMKLLVIPSYSEGGPLIAIEAIACGTPVLSTTVGIIPDIITDGKTGFILEDNSPECIAKNIIRALCNLDLEEITIKAHTLIEKERSYEAAVKSIQRCIRSIAR
jgi:glycosyltransferase involved in cell wall biosynthesis